MKRIRKIFTLFIVICIMISSVTVYAGENGEINMRDGGRLGEAHVVAEYKLSEMKKNKPKTEYYYANVDDLRLADPFIIYIANQNSQDEIYEFPVYDIQTGKIIYIIDVFSVEDRDGFMCELSLGYVDELNDLDYLIHPDDVLIYRIGRTVCFEYDGNVYAYDKKVDWTDWVMSDEEIGFVQGTKETRKKLIHNRIEKGMLPASFPELSVNDTENALMNGNLTLYNPRLQYGYAMCWACAVATVYNYLYTGSITGFDVCNIMSIGYNAGGTIINEKDGLNCYGVVYNVMKYATHTNQSLLMSYSNITYNISASYPVILNGYSSTGNHAVTIYGYNGSSSASNNLSIFDSAYSSVSSGKRTYSWSDGYFLSNGTTYYELSTLSKY